MPRTLKVQLTAPSPLLVHDFRNFGEDIYRELCEECEVSMAEIDAAASEFDLRNIPKRQIRTIAAKVRKIAEQYTKLSSLQVFEPTDGINPKDLI